MLVIPACLRNSPLLIFLTLLLAFDLFPLAVLPYPLRSTISTLDLWFD